MNNGTGAQLVHKLVVNQKIEHCTKIRISPVSPLRLESINTNSSREISISAASIYNVPYINITITGTLTYL